MDKLSAALELATQHYTAGRLQSAKQIYRQILATEPGNVTAWHRLGLIAFQTANLVAAGEYLARAVALLPEFAEGYTDLGAVFQVQGELVRAIACHRRALELAPQLSPANFNLGCALQAQGKLAESAECYRRAVDQNPDYWKAHNNLGVVLRKLGQAPEALAHFRRALELKPDYAEAYNNLGNACRDAGEAEEAIHHYRRALQLRPDYAEAFCNLGTATRALGNSSEAAAYYCESLRLAPDFPNAHWNQSLLMLLHGDFERGWREYEWRWKTDELPTRVFDRPRWDGQPLDGRTILLHAEQGLGDTLQFIRYAALVKSQGGTVLVECQKPLKKLLAGCPGVDHFIAAGEELPPFDVHCPLLSLPAVFATTVPTIPANIPYLFANPALVEKWRERLNQFPGFRIGIHWQGGPRQGEFRKRDLPVDCLASLAQLPNVRLISLQKGEGRKDLIRAGTTLPIIDLGEDIDETNGSFMDTAAIMMNLDLVITSDTAIPHLAGALGVPVWVALPFVPEWRWMQDRADSPWYSTARLFRQKAPGDWSGVFEEIRAELFRRISLAPELRAAEVIP